MTLRATTFLLLFPVVLLTSCDRADEKAQASATTTAQSKDIPILPVKKGDRWIYDVRLEIPADVTSPGAA
ncbi:MAG: hypothetical protein EOP85_15015, partial [Verrucomicrobiaceae bacterium]